MTKIYLRWKENDDKLRLEAKMRNLNSKHIKIVLRKSLAGNFLDYFSIDEEKKWNSNGETNQLMFDKRFFR
jgi:hypothetical protein